MHTFGNIGCYETRPRIIKVEDEWPQFLSTATKKWWPLQSESAIKYK